MTKDGVIELAKAAGFDVGGNAEIYNPRSNDTWPLTDYLHQFAILVAKAEREACAKWLDRYDGEGKRRAEAIRNGDHHAL